MKKFCYAILYVIMVSIVFKSVVFASDYFYKELIYGYDDTQNNTTQPILFLGKASANAGKLYEVERTKIIYANDDIHYEFDAGVANDKEGLKVRYNWLYAVKRIVTGANSSSAMKSIDNYDSSTIADTIKGLELARKEIGSFIGGDKELTNGNVTPSFKMWVPFLGVVGEKDYGSELMPSKIRSSKAFHNIIDKEMPIIVANDYVEDATIKAKVDEVFAKYDKKIYSAIQNLRAALDSKNKNGSKDGIYIRDNYKTKFLYTLPQIKTYSAFYSLNNLGDNLSSTEQEQIKRAWGAKAAAKAAGYPNIETSQDIYVRKVYDDKNTKLNYNKDQIWMYLQIFPPTTRLFTGMTEKSDEDEIVVKWANKLSGTNDYNVQEREKAYEYLKKIPNVVDSGLKAIADNTEAVINITSTTKTDAEQEADAAAADSKNFKIYAEKYTLPEKIGSKNGDTNATDLDTIIDSADSFINSGDDNKVSEKSMENLSDSIYSILLIVGVIVAVIVGAILGIKFMTGSVEQQADVKKLLVPYIVGCVVVFGAFGIWKIAVTIIASI